MKGFTGVIRRHHKMFSAHFKNSCLFQFIQSQLKKLLKFLKFLDLANYNPLHLLLYIFTCTNMKTKKLQQFHMYSSFNCSANIMLKVNLERGKQMFSHKKIFLKRRYPGSLSFQSAPAHKVSHHTYPIGKNYESAFNLAVYTAEIPTRRTSACRIMKCLKHYKAFITF